MDTIKPQATLQLIGYGRVAAIQASELKAGDVMMCNYGFTAKVLDIKPRNKTQITVTTLGGERCFNKTRLVAVKGL